jgi:YidC/Oxa1 family membrane protein insertase
MEENKFDLNTFIGFLLIGGIIVWMTWGGIGQDIATETSGSADTTIVEGPNEEVLPSADNGTVASFSNSAFVTDSVLSTDPVVLENDYVKIVFSKIGAVPNSVLLKDYNAYNGDTVDLFANTDFAYNWKFDVNGATYSTSKLPFNVAQESSNEVAFSIQTTAGNGLQLVYKLGPDDRFMTQEVVNKGLLPAESEVEVSMSPQVLEKSLKNERNNTAIFYRAAPDDVESLSLMGSDDEVADRADWIAFKQQFFATIIQRDAGFKEVSLAQTAPESETIETVKEFSATYAIPSAEKWSNTWYFLPTQYHLLEAYNENFEELIPLGWAIFRWVNKWLVIPVFDRFNAWGWNYGIIILVMALLVKLILSPFQLRSYLSMAKMRVLKPEMDEINAKHEDPMKRQQAVMELYRKTGANPLGGCLPMLFQLPFLIALFRFFPASFELRQQSFLWADDLSSYDSIVSLPFSIPFYGDHVSLFTLLMALSMFFYTRMNQQMTPSTGDNAMAKQMQMIQYFMPVMMLFWFNTYASGLSYYYFLANVISFAQQGIIRKFFIDEEEIHRQIQEKKAAPRKKSKFQERLDQMMKEQQRQRKGK